MCDGRSEGPTEAVLSTRKLKEVVREGIRRPHRAALTPYFGWIRNLRAHFVVVVPAHLDSHEFLGLSGVLQPLFCQKTINCRREEKKPVFQKRE